MPLNLAKRTSGCSPARSVEKKNWAAGRTGPPKGLSSRAYAHSRVVGGGLRENLPLRFVASISAFLATSSSASIIPCFTQSISPLVRHRNRSTGTTEGSRGHLEGEIVVPTRRRPQTTLSNCFERETPRTADKHSLLSKNSTGKDKSELDPHATGWLVINPSQVCPPCRYSSRYRTASQHFRSVVVRGSNPTSDVHGKANWMGSLVQNHSPCLGEIDHGEQNPTCSEAHLKGVSSHNGVVAVRDTDLATERRPDTLVQLCLRAIWIQDRCVDHHFHT